MALFKLSGLPGRMEGATQMNAGKPGEAKSGPREGRLRQCPVCQAWFHPVGSQTTCSHACSQELSRRGEGRARGRPPKEKK